MKVVLALLWLLWLVLLLTACAQPSLPPIPEGTCTRNARLPNPPRPAQRTIPVLLQWSNTAASVANRAIDERDLCVGSYDRLHQWAVEAAKR